MSIAGSLCAALALTASPPLQAAKPADEKPRVVVVLVFDQMVPEQLERLSARWTGGFKRVLASGRRFTSARYDYAGTETGPGHTTIGTGRQPFHHGIVANEWMPPEKGDAEYCVADATTAPVRAAPNPVNDGRSPKNIHGEGLSDILKRADPLSKCITLSTKDRAAIGMGGQHPDLAAWWDLGGSGYMSSRWYVEQLPEWLSKFDADWFARAKQSELFTGWKSSLPEDLSGTRTAADDRAGEVNFLDGRHTFPYAAPKLGDPPSEKDRAALANYAYKTPLGDELLLAAARAAIDGAQLGADEHTDYLAVSCSGCDIVGHMCGPFSREVTDLLVRDDRALGELFDALDRRAGADRWVAVLTADHGVLDLPEALKESGVDAVRVSGKSLSASLKALRADLKEKFGDDFYVDADAFGVRLSNERIAKAGVEPKLVRQFAKESFLAHADWCARVFTRDELAAALGHSTDDELLHLESQSFDAVRSSDLVFLQKERSLVAMSAGTTHGTPYAYDRCVPLVFFGAGVAPGTDARAASPVDITPTLCARAGVARPDGLDGRPLPLR